MGPVREFHPVSHRGRLTGVPAYTSGGDESGRVSFRRRPSKESGGVRGGGSIGGSDPV